MMADVMRHFHARQHLGKAVVVTDNPAELLAAAHKQWLKLGRSLQQRRGAASNPVEILKYTYTITRMQHLELVARTPEEAPEAAMFFVRPQELKMLPASCLTVYFAGAMDEAVVARIMKQLPNQALIVDYGNQVEAGDFGLRTKQEAERQVADNWRLVEAFLVAQRIDTRLFRSGIAGWTEEMDDAMDVLLGVEAEFLGLAAGFQRTLDLARPLRTIPKLERDQYELLLMLAHRVQTLSPRGFSPQFLATYADDAFFMSDRRLVGAGLAEEIARQAGAGRWNIVRALMARSGGSRETWPMLTLAV